MWALKRRLAYGFILVIAVVAVTFFYFRGQLLAPATCADGIQNGIESGVDCGGSCSLICAPDRFPVETLWATTFLNDDASYDIGIMLRNKNSGSAPKVLSVTVLLKNDAGDTLFSQVIESPVPLASEFPLVIQNLALKEKPTKVIVKNEEDYSYALTNKVINPVSSEGTFDESSKKSVFVTLVNRSKKDLFRFPVRVVLYDKERQQIGVSESFVDRLLEGETKNIEVVLGKKYEVSPQTVRAYTVFDPYAF